MILVSNILKALRVSTKYDHTGNGGTCKRWKESEENGRKAD